MRGVDFRIQISLRTRSQNRNGLKGNVRDLGQSDLCKNIGKTGSLPCPFKFFDADSDPGSGIFWTLDPRYERKKFGSGINIPDPQHCFQYNFFIRGLTFITYHVSWSLPLLAFPPALPLPSRVLCPLHASGLTSGLTSGRTSGLTSSLLSFSRRHHHHHHPIKSASLKVRSSEMDLAEIRAHSTGRH
jgi:hypothetical protein